ncbi:MAG: phosphotransferase [Bacillales bacterium]|nr:phosphotransferase [Bacillales bacterium]
MKDINLFQENKIKRLLAESLPIDINNIHYVKRIIGGMSNKTYLFSCGKEEYSVHISDKLGDDFVSRDAEREAFHILSLSGIVPEAVYLNEKDNRYRIFKYIPGSALDKLDYKKYYFEIAESFHILHSAKLLSKNYEPFVKIYDLKDKVKEEKDPLFFEVFSLLENRKKDLENRPLYFCHNDSQPSNLILGDNNKVYVIDFEFAGNNDYLYDIATFGNLDFTDSINMLKIYKEDASEEEYEYLKLWRLFINLQWYLVALIKHETGFDERLKINFKDVAEFFLKSCIPIFEEIKK